MVPMTQDSLKHILLVGGGHAHTYILRELQQHKLPGTRVTLLSANRYQYYSGMFSGYMEGKYDLEEIRIDLARLCEQASIQFLEGKAVRIHAQDREVVTESGERIHYDIVSFNIGSGTAGLETPGLQLAHNAFIKPNHNIEQVKAALLSKERIVVVGGGSSGIELSLSLQANPNRNQKFPVTLLHSGQLLEDRGVRITKRIVDVVRNKGIRLIQNESVVSVLDHQLITNTDNRIPFDGLLWLTGAATPSVFRDSGLPINQQGYLHVTDQLQSITHPTIFGAGDCISLQSRPGLPKAGVYAVRQAPVLWMNIQRYLNGKKLRSFRPPSAYLSILSTGDEEALLLYGKVSLYGSWWWLLKRQIDTNFMTKFR